MTVGYKNKQSPQGDERNVSDTTITHPRRADGRRTRKAILETAVDLASVEGLDNLTIGRLAARAEMSKSGLFAHFGSKEGLQIATVEEARQRYVREVLTAVLATPDGLLRLTALCEATLSYLQRRIFPGGCFFALARAAFAARPGAVHDALSKNKDWSRRFTATLIRKAQGLGQIRPEVEPEQLAFELEALWDAPNWTLHDDGGEAELARARTALENRLSAAQLLS